MTMNVLFVVALFHVGQPVEWHSFPMVSAAECRRDGPTMLRVLEMQADAAYGKFFCVVPSVETPRATAKV